MLLNFKEWWQKPLTREDRIIAVVVSAIGGAIVGFIARIFVGPTPAPITEYLVWSALGLALMSLLSAVFPRPVSLICAPFVKLLEGV